MMIRIGFVRHGCTAWNKERRAQGNSDIPLDEEGKLQADCIGQRLAAESWEVIYSSDLQRAKQTATLIGQHIREAEVHLDARLREVNGGLIEGTTEAERIEKWGEEWREKDLGIEDRAAVVTRGMAFIQDVLQKQEGKHVLVVSHGSFIKHMLRTLFPGMDMEASLDNCSLTLVTYQKDAWELELHNCTKHFHEGMVR